MGNRLSLSQHRHRWALWTLGAIFLAALAITVVSFVNKGTIDPEPWGYIAMAVAVLSALGGLALAFAMAALVSQGEPPPPRSQP